MDFRRTSLLLTTSIFLLFAPLSLLAGSQENPLVQAIKLFDQNKFEEAEDILSELIIEQPDNQMINYFYGACRTENQHYGQKEILYLLKGSTGESPLKTDYYLGVQYHAQNRWDDALKSYQMFQKECTTEEANQLNLDEKIRQCNEHINPFSSLDNEIEDVAPAAISRPERAVEAVSAAAVYPDENTVDSVNLAQVVADSMEPEIQQEKIVPEVQKSEPIEFVLNDEFTYIDTSNFRTKEGLDAFLKWKSDQQSLDSLTTFLNQLRSDYASARNIMQKNELGQKIIHAENQMLPLQRKTKDELTAARLAENNYWNNASQEEHDTFSEELHMMVGIHDTTETPIIPKLDTSSIIAEVFEDVIPIAPVVKKEETKDELVYKIQIGAYSRGVPGYIQKKFDKLSYIRKIDNYTDNRGVVVYTTGNLTNLDDAVKMQKQVRQEGIEDAFVVPYFNGKRITLEEAKKIEKER